MLREYNNKVCINVLLIMYKKNKRSDDNDSNLRYLLLIIINYDPSNHQIK